MAWPCRSIRALTVTTMPRVRGFGRDAGADIPVATKSIPLKPLLNAFGNETGFRVVLFTLDESTYSRELAPLAGHYPACGSARRGGSTTASRA